MTPRVEGVVFDLDGVLADTEVIAYEALRMLLAPQPLTWDTYATIIGTSMDVTLDWLRTRYRRTEPPEVLRQLTSDHIHRALDEATLEPMEGVPALVDAIRARGLRLGVASQSSHRWVEQVLTAIGIRPYVEIIATASDVSRGKPAPDVYLHAAASLGVAPGRTIAVEDSVPGIESASSAGLMVVQLRAAEDAPPPHPSAQAVLASLTRFDLAWLDAGLPG